MGRNESPVIHPLSKAGFLTPGLPAALGYSGHELPGPSFSEEGEEGGARDAAGYRGSSFGNRKDSGPARQTDPWRHRLVCS